MKTEIQRLEKEFAKADRDSKKAAMARAALGPDASRAAMTTANARWMRNAEYRDKIASKLDAARGPTPPGPSAPEAQA